jgi:hypothetical protein
MDHSVGHMGIAVVVQHNYIPQEQERVNMASLDGDKNV